MISWYFHKAFAVARQTNFLFVALAKWAYFYFVICGLEFNPLLESQEIHV